MTKETTTNNQEIKTLSWLEKKITDKSIDWSKIKKDLKEIYGIDIENEVFSITQEELNKLNSEITSSNDKLKTIYENLFKEKIETKIQTNWIKEANLDNTIYWINDKRINQLKDIISNWIDKLLEKDYQFLWVRKELFKLSIINSLLNWDFWEQLWDLTWWLWQLTVDLSTFDEETLKGFANWSSTIDLQSPWNDIKKTFENTIKKHLQILWEIKKVFDSQNPKLTLEEQKNVLSNIPNFNNLDKLNNLTRESIKTILTWDFIKQNKDKYNDWKDENISSLLTQSMLELRKKIEDKKERLNTSWDMILENFLDLTSKDWVIWDLSKNILWALLKIPFIWKIIAMFLWLSGDNHENALESQVKWYKLLRKIKEIWKDIEIFKWKILPNLDTKTFLPNFKELSSLKPDKIDEKTFLINIFWKNWQEIKIDEKTSISLKVNIEHTDFKNNEINQETLNKRISEWINKYKEDLKEKTKSDKPTVSKDE